jgi:hypothetical protein
MHMQRSILLAAVVLTTPTWSFGAAVYEWTFNNGTLADSFSNGTMTAVGGVTTTIVPTNGTTIPHIGGVPAQVLHVPRFTLDAEGFNLAFNASTGNGGSLGNAFINQYTFVFDIYSPGAPDWQALFNTNPNNTNDADWYIAPDNALGIGPLYSAPGAISQDTWTRIAFTADLSINVLTFYVDGILVAQGPGNGVDGRWALFSNVDPGDDVRLFNEGDQTGVYTHEMYVNSIALTDRELSSAEIGALGGSQAQGILIPEPGTALLCGLAGVALCGSRRPRRAGRLA